MKFHLVLSDVVNTHFAYDTHTRIFLRAATCSQEKRRGCIRKNRHSCDPDGTESECGDCIDNYEPSSENDSDSPCVERFIPVPISAEIEGIDLSTRSQRIQLQNAFRRMVDQLNAEMSVLTNNFEQIDRNDVVLVRSPSNPSPGPKPFEWVGTTFSHQNKVDYISLQKTTYPV